MRILSITIFTICFLACSTEGFEDISQEANFSVSASIGGQDFLIEAGVDDVSNLPSFSVQNEKINYSSSFSIPASTGSIYRKFNIHFKQYEALHAQEEIEQVILNNSLDYLLGWTGVEGLSLLPSTNDIVDPFITTWNIDGQQLTTQLSPLVPLPVIRDQDFVDVNYSLTISDKFSGFVNSKLKLDVADACYGYIEISKLGDKADLELISPNQELSNIQWSNGSMSNSTQIDLIPQAIIVQASSPDCAMNAQMEINDPVAVPNSFGFDVIQMDGPAFSEIYQGLVIELIDQTGKIYRSDYGIQTAETSLEFDAIEAFEDSPSGDPSIKVSMKLSCVLHNLEDDDTILIEDAIINFAFAYPAE